MCVTKMPPLPIRNNTKKQNTCQISAEKYKAYPLPEQPLIEWRTRDAGVHRDETRTTSSHRTSRPVSVLDAPYDIFYEP